MQATKKRKRWNCFLLAVAQKQGSSSQARNFSCSALQTISIANACLLMNTFKFNPEVSSNFTQDTYLTGCFPTEKYT